ncbi:glutathione S-transferase family protein [Rhodovibrionaceae bacterium A322]
MSDGVKLHYFAGRGRAETTRWMLAVNEISFANHPIDSPQALANLRASRKLPFDQMPLLEIDGKNLSQSSAIVRYLARKGDLYGRNREDELWCDMIAGTVADFAEAPMQAAFQPTEAIAVASLQTRFAKFAPHFERRLLENGSGFCAGTEMTFADVLLAEALCSYQEWIPDVLDRTPLLSALYERIISNNGIAAYLQSPQRYPMADEAYVIDVASVLQRALPPHLPNPNRFLPG